MVVTISFALRFTENGAISIKMLKVIVEHVFNFKAKQSVYYEIKHITKLCMIPLLKQMNGNLITRKQIIASVRILLLK
jgi:hypothetical protein